MFTINQECIYTPNGQECQIMKLYGDRHRARVKMANGQELDEVAWHDLVPKEGVQAPVPEGIEGPVEVPLTEIQEDVRYEAEKPPRRFWPHREEDQKP